MPILSFFSVFWYKISDALFISNFIFFIYVFWKWTFKKENIKVLNSKSLLALLFYYLFVFISILVGIINGKALSLRIVFQFLFSLQYLFFVIRVDFTNFEKYYKRFSIVLSCAIIVMFFVTKTFMYGANFYVLNRFWARPFIPAWPNGIVISLLFGLFLYVKQEKLKWQPILILIVAVVLTTSRAGLVGMMILFASRLYIRSKRKMSLIIGTVIAVILLNVALIALRSDYALVYSRLFVMDDRAILVKFIIEALENKSLLGHNGYTIYQVYPDYYFPHTHNFVLEIAFRYGIVATISFLAFTIVQFFSFKDNMNRAGFFMLIAMALTQGHFTSFNYIILIIFLINDDYRMKKSVEKEVINEPKDT